MIKQKRVGSVCSGILGSVCSGIQGSVSSGQMGSVWTEFPDMAQLCPYIEGPGVYMARALLVGVDTIPQNYYNFCEIDNEPGTGKWDGDYTLPITATQISEEIEIIVYPNPATNEIYIKVIADQALSGIVNMYDVVGNEVLNQTINYSLTKINVEKLNSGVYLYKVTIGAKFWKDRIVLIK